MANDPVPVLVNILGKEFRIACPPDEKDELLASARYVDVKMRELRDRGRTHNTDTIAIMVALNIAHDLLQAQSVFQREDKSLTGKLKHLQEKIDAALNSARQIEI